MKVLVIGSGGREHTLAWCLAKSDAIESVICIPGNGGTATLDKCQNVDLSVTDFPGIEQVAIAHDPSLIVVGPEAPLAVGMTDYFQDKGFTVFGPRQAGAQIEASKAWAKALMADAGIPTAKAAVFTNAATAKAYVAAEGAPIVVKADGLAAGKGVTVAKTVDEANHAIEDAFAGRFGAAGHQVVIEACLEGQEASVLAITDGKTIRALVPAQDHKAVGEGDTGANTGGMGAYAPTPVMPTALMERVQQDVLEPAIATLRSRGIDYRGVLYAGLMITPDGTPQVIEFNCRFGDPETQVVLPLLDTPLESLLLACAEQRLADHPPIKWKSSAAACVVLASGGYPGSYEKGFEIHGIEAAEAEGATVFHAGTALANDQVVTSGGRVLGVTALGETFEQAIANAYRAVDQIRFEGMYCRRDIGFRVLYTLHD